MKIGDARQGAPRARRALHALGLALLYLALAGPAAAEEPVRFLIERIVVEGLKRASAAEIVVAESRLSEGREYTEQQLREAVYRVKRLPFVLEAELSLRKGSERGAYELVVAVEETKPLFVTAEAIGSRLDAPSLPFRPRRDWEWDGFGGLGLRAFVGSWGVAFATLDLEDGIQAGYTRYNLFGRGGFGSASLLLADLGEREAGFLALSLAAGVPLVGNHSLRTDLTYSQDQIGGDFPSRDRIAVGTAEVEWRYDTTDDPFVPSRGLLTTAAVAYSRSDTRIRVPVGQPGPEPVFELEERTAESRGIELTGTRHWPLSPRQSVSLDGRAGVSRFTSDLPFGGGELSAERWAAGVGAGHALSLWGPATARRWGDLRLETRLGFDYADPSDRVLGGFDPETVATARAAVVFRNAWAVLRVGAEYRRLDGDFQEGVLP